MPTHFDSFNMITDTGGNASRTSPNNYGVLAGLAYRGISDTGIQIDTGAVITLTADTGNFSIPLFVGHIVPNGASWYKPLVANSYDTGGGAISGSYQPYVFAGEKVTAAVQGISTDTGKTVDLNLYWID